MNSKYFPRSGDIIRMGDLLVEFSSEFDLDVHHDGTAYVKFKGKLIEQGDGFKMRPELMPLQTEGSTIPTDAHAAKPDGLGFCMACGYAVDAEIHNMKSPLEQIPLTASGTPEK